ncbi:MAG: PAS domain-containing sensor histidine kinase [Planctomycetota bacterium]
MRISLRIPLDPLGAALADLLTEAGHVVTFGADEAFDLLVVTEQRAVRPPAGTPVLCLRPCRGGRPDPSPGRALADAIRTGGTAVWSHPLDPAELLRALAPGTAAPTPSRAAEPSFLLAHLPGAWASWDPHAREWTWTNRSARARLGEPDPGGDLPPLDRILPDLARPILEGRQGTGLATFSGCRHLVVWGTDPRGWRVLGLLELPASDSRLPDNTRTLAEIGRISSTLVHELRNPIASLVGALDLLERSEDPEDRREIRGLARQRLRQMQTLLDETLRLARPFKDAPEPLDLSLVIQSALSTVRTDPLFSEIRVAVDLRHGNAAALGYAEPLRQSLVNLLLNAAQAQDGRGAIRVSCARDDVRLLLRVADDGPGIPAAQRDQVFAPFWTTRPAGTGLGLAYVRRVAEACGGRAVVEDAAAGACVRIELPFAHPATGPVPPAT